MRRLCKHIAQLLAVAVTMLLALGSFGAAIDLQGVNKGSTNYNGGPLNGWFELEFIPCRVVLNNPGSNQVVVFFDNNANGKPGIQNLFNFVPSSNVVMSTPVLTASSTLQDWFYTINANVTNSQTGYIYYQARMAAGAHLFGGASLHMYNPQLQLAKPVPVSGTPDLVIIKTGTAIVTPGQTVTYSVTFSNKFTAANAALGVEIHDTLPTGMTWANTWSGSPGVQFLQSLGNELWWDIPDLQPGDSGTLTYQVTIATNASNGTVLQNDAQILCTQNDANMADNVSIVTSTVSAALPPNAVPDSYSVNQNQTLTVSAPGVLTNDSDPGNGTLKAVLSTNVTSGTLTLNTNGSFTYMPPANFSGTVYFYYFASNATNSSPPVKVTINVFHFAAPADASLSCAASIPAAATNLTQFLSQGGIDGGPYCGQPTALSFPGDSSNGGTGCAASPLVVTRTYKLTTGCGDVTNVVQRFTVVDTTSPVISAFPADATYSCAGQVPAPNDSLVTASDNCSAITVTHNTDSVTSSNCVDRFTISRTYVVSDACGNSTSRIQMITVNSTTPPTITAFPPDATFSCAAAVPAADDTLVTAANACGGSAGLVITHATDVATSSNCVNRLTLSRKYIATDACGNSSSKTQMITVNGTTPPTVVTFPFDLTVSCSSAVPAPDNSLVTATDNCGGSATVTISHDADVVASSNCVSRFVITRTYRATDACGNVTSRSQAITVNQNKAPTIVAFPADATFSCASAVLIPDDSQVTATDGCGSSSVTISHGPDVITSSNCPSRFTISRTYVATDTCGNSSSKTQIVVVNGTVAPAITIFPVDATYSCASAVPVADDSVAAAIDNCGTSEPVRISHDPDAISSSNCVGRFTISRTYRATDACGNIASKTQIITVNATTPPTITAVPPDATYACSDAVPAANDSLVTAIDGCGGSAGLVISHLADTVGSSNCVNRFTITRTYVSTDACGNSSSKSQTITINATNAPVITGFPIDVTYVCAAAVPAADDSLIIASDNCTGSPTVNITHDADVITSSNCVNRFTIVRTYRATDSCGNVSTKNQTITVNATTPPVITGSPNDATYSCASAVPVANDSLVTAVDNCGGNSSTVVTHNADVITPGICANRFGIARTYIATDACGNSSSITQTITVNQTTPPTITTLPADATYSCASAVPAADDSQVSAIDGCGGSAGVVVTHNTDAITSSNCVNRFTITRAYIATDACGNASSKSQTITVNGTIAPTITAFPADATVLCATGVSAPNDSLVTANDNCGASSTVTITHDADVIGSSNCVSRFTITRTYRATDACGNVTTRNQTITVNATTPPTISGFPVDATYSCAGAVPAANDSLVTAIDGCGGTGGIVISHGGDVITSSNCVSRFTISRSYIATDACGNSSSKVQTIVVNGTTAPTITGFPGDVTYACAGAVPAANDTLVSAVDNCGGAGVVTITHDADVITSSNCVNRFTIARTYHATDACGTVTSKNQTITVNATIAPVITTFPEDATYSCASAVPAAVDTLVSAIDNCGANSSAVITHTADVITPGACANRFTLARTYVATDACGNSSSRTQTITVSQVTPPTIVTFPNDATYSCANTVPSADDRLVSAIDGCGSGTGIVISHFSDSVSVSNCVNRFTVSRTYVATDACGNSSSKSQTILVTGTTPPTITGFPVDATYTCAGSVPVPDDTLVAATNGCGGSSGVVISHLADSIGSSNCVNRFTIARTYLATDACGNSSSKTQTITVNGTTAPLITAFPSDATFLCASAVPAPNNSLVGATNACGGNSGVVITHTPDVVTSSNCVNRFNISRTYIATDACGNSSSKTQTITVNQVTPPTIVTLPTDATYSCANTVPSADDRLVSATDGCGSGAGVVISHLSDSLSASNCVNRFTISRTYIATDACGNSSSKRQTILVTGTTPPTITGFPVDATYSCAGSVPVADDTLVAATNGCGGSSGVVISHLADSVGSSNCVNRFAITRTYVATDACGNSSSKSQKITVNGTTAPTITSFPADVTVSCAGLVPAADNGSVGGTNACGGNAGLVISHAADVTTSSNCVNRFTIIRTYIATDACGNSSSKSQTILVNGTTPPTITSFPADATYSCAGAVPVADNSLVVATNACGGNSGIIVTHNNDSIVSSNCVNRFTIARTYLATDACGNSSSKTQTITVNGTTPPLITTFPSDATYSCASAVPAPNDSNVSATNACGGNSGVIITHTPDVVTSSNCVNRFNISRTYIATDACGNSSSKTQTITVNAITPPTITAFPADATFACSVSVPGANDSLVTAQDNCGGLPVVITHDADVITSSNCINHFTITRTYRATDACGNATSKNQTIVVNDTQAPTMSCPAAVTVSLPSDIPVPDPSRVTAADNCSVPQKSFVADSNSTNGYAVTITRTYAATDDCGNRSTCSQTITFNPLLAKPTANPDSYSVLENKVLNVSVPGVLGNDTDPNNLPLQTVIVSGPTNGSLTLNANGSFQYTPNTNYFGPDSFTYKASNTGTPSDAVKVTIDVGFVNQQPSFTKGADISVLEDSITSTTTHWATNIKPGPANESNQLLNFIVSNDNSNLFTIQPSIATNGTVTFTPIPLTIGSANITVVLHDNGGTDNGGVDTSVAQIFVITIVPVNHPPSFTKGADQIVNNYAGAQTRLNWASNLLAGPAHESWQALDFIVSNTKNSIFSSSPAISTNGTLSFAPTANKYGVATVSVALHDNGGTANGGVDTSPTQTFFITVNNPPSVSIITPTNTSLFLYPSPVTITADAYDVDGFVTNVTFLNGTNVIGQGVPEDDDLYSFTWTNAPSTNSVLYAIATDNYGATNVSAPINIQLGNPVMVSGGPIVFSPSLFSWGQKLSVTNPTISTVQSVTVTFTSISSGVSVQGVTGTNALGQPFITFNNTVGPVSSIANYATILYVASSQPVVTFTTSASLTAGPTFTVNSTNLVKVTRFKFQTDGSTLVNFVSNSNKTYYVQYTLDLKNWFTSPLPLKGNGTQMQWVDFGPGATESAPKSTAFRFYRVVAP